MSEQLLNAYGKGATLLFQMGYVPGKGLGENGRGIVEPILPTVRKRGEGIKVDDSNRNKMETRYVDEWSDADKTSDSDDNDDDDNAKGKELGFLKSGVYKSEYDIPDLWTIFRRLEILVDLSNADKVAMEGMMHADDSDCSSRLLQQELWKTVLELEKMKTRESLLRKEQEKLEKGYSLINGDIQALKNILQTDLSDKSVSGNMLDLWMDYQCAKLSETWTKEIKECDMKDISRFGELLEKAENYSKECNFNEPPQIIFENDRIEGRHAIIVFSKLDSVLIVPIIERFIGFFGGLWDVEQVEWGNAVYEELRDSELIGDEQIFEFLVNERIVLPKLKQCIDAWEIDGCFLDGDGKETHFLYLIIPWLKLLGTKLRCQLIDYVIEKLCQWLQHYPHEITTERLAIWKVNLCLELSSNGSKHLLKVQRSIMYNLICKLRKNLNVDKTDAWSWMNDENFHVLSMFFRKVDEFELSKFDKSINNEIMIPLWIGYLQLFEHKHDSEDFLREMTGIFSNYGLLNDSVKYPSIVKGLTECWEHANYTSGLGLQSKRVISDFMDIDSLIGMREENCWKVLNHDGEPNTDKKERVMSRNEVKSMKDLLFMECEKRGIPIIPLDGKVYEGKQVYQLKRSSDKRLFSVVFEPKLIFDTDKKEYVSLDDLFQ